MAAVLATIFLGAVVGGIYAVSAFGLVLTYRTTGVFNFAQGALGMFAAFAFAQLTQGGRVGLVAGVYEQTWTLPAPVALVVVVAILAPVTGLLLDRVLFRWLRDTSQLVQIVATIGLLVAVQGMAGVMWGAATTLSPRGVFSERVLTAGGFRASVAQLMSMAVVMLLAVALVAFMRRTSLGVRMRAVVDRAELAELVGVDAGRVSALSWALGTAFAALAGILVVPFFGSLDPLTLTFLVVAATAAAVVGRLESFGLTLAGGLGIGVAQMLVLRYTDSEIARQLRPSIPFLVLFGVLFLPRWRRERLPGRTDGRPLRPRPEPLSGFGPIGGLFAVLVAAPFLLGPSWQTQLSRLPAMGIIFLSLVVVSGFAGQISLSQAALAGFGAFVTAHLVVDGVAFAPAVLIGSLAAVPLGAFLASRAVTLSPIFLAFATLAFGAVMDEVAFTSGAFAGGLGGIFFDRPEALASSRVYYLVTLAVFAAAAAAVTRLRHARTGLFLHAMRDSEAGLAVLGVSGSRLKFTAFVASAGLAALGGALLSAADELATPLTYFKFQSLLILALAVIGGIGGWQGALTGAALLQLGPPFVHDLVTGDNVVSELLAALDVPGDNVEALLPVLFGVGAIGLARNPHGLAEQIRGGLARLGLPLAERDSPVPAPKTTAPVEPVAAGRLVFPPGRLVHRPGCLLARGKTGQPVDGDAAGLEACPVCEPV